MCIFCKIGAKKISSEIVYEDQDILAFKDIHPIAPVHILIIPKKHLSSANDFLVGNQELAGKMLAKGAEIARDLNISENGYKLLIRTGKDGGQEVPHLHLHLIGGAPLHEEIMPV